MPQARSLISMASGYNAYERLQKPTSAGRLCSVESSLHQRFEQSIATLLTGLDSSYDDRCLALSPWQGADGAKSMTGLPMAMYVNSWTAGSCLRLKVALFLSDKMTIHAMGLIFD